MNIITNIQGHGELTFLCAIWRAEQDRAHSRTVQQAVALQPGQSEKSKIIPPCPHNEMKKSQFIKSSILTDSLAVRCADFTPSGK